MKHEKKCSLFQGTLKQHIVHVHEKIKNFECKYCQKKFGTKDKMENHVVVVHEKFKPFKCEECGKEFGQKSNYQRHYEIVHEGKKSFGCNICFVNFSTAGNLKAHTEAVHEKKKSYSCEKCNLLFHHPSSLKRHRINVHEKVKVKIPVVKPKRIYRYVNHKNSVCIKIQRKEEITEGREFSDCNNNSRARDPKAHAKAVHKKKKSYSCKKCNDLFYHSNSLKRHRINLHEKVKVRTHIVKPKRIHRYVNFRKALCIRISFFLFLTGFSNILGTHAARI